ncbi:sprouty-related, EVH1 domain-containing protein 2-like isoform X2 [Synchiropus splendidus]|uniref:sprouty-related, EVH1 domain-containing protein 2-like isoform X2 n=1 Tax=Synchiropus splendidus TaxID=270530 RepID=UPI00237D97D3|nr:sprouty-related, EVH1 domain-containing protein 2-like isoform X2 [Synchiropus splendidus]
MIEETHPNDDSYIVRVKAVVMTRDDSSGGWLAQDGGALSRVGVCRLRPPELPPVPAAIGAQFLIRGERLPDKQVILDCPLRKDILYIIANPTFHHWKVEDRRCGLSFQSPADARAFDRGVRKAIEDLAEGSTTSSTALQNEGELGDDDVFTSTTDSSSNSSQKLENSAPPLESSPLPHRHRYMLGNRPDLHEPYRLTDHYFLDQPLSRLPHVTFQEDEEIVRINPRERSWERTSERLHGRPSDRSWLTGYEDYRHASVRDKFLHTDHSGSYVHFDKTDAPKHDYTYPLAPSQLSPDSDPAIGPLGNKGHGGGSYRHGFSVVSSQPRSFLPSSSPSANGGKGRKEDGKERAHCEHCGEAFYVSDNRRGQCQDAPDPVRGCIRRVSCMWLADTMLYHCMSDPEGDYTDPCSCDGGEGGRFGPRWLALTGLSLVAPCLCLYPPLHACHRAGLACGCCGGRHKALLS